MVPLLECPRRLQGADTQGWSRSHHDPWQAAVVNLDRWRVAHLGQQQPGLAHDSSEPSTAGANDAQHENADVRAAVQDAPGGLDATYSSRPPPCRSRVRSSSHF